MPDLTPTWQRLSVISGALAAVLVPLALGFAGNELSKAIKERDVQARFVELAVGILREPPRGGEADSIRSWATGILSKYSGVEMTRAVKKALEQTTPLPGPISSISRIYLLAGNRQKAEPVDSLRADLVRAGFNIVGENPALVDKERPDGPEIRYFDLSDRTQAEALAEKLQGRLGATLKARAFQDSRVKPGYIEIWLGR